MIAPLGPHSSTCALIPHFECEEWLAQAIESLLDQTRPLDAIVVIDDGSDEPPVDIVAEYPEVTLLAATDNGGPYRLVQAVIDTTEFDAYLFQDADDWSAPDRLERLLDEAAASASELVGSHEVRVLVDEGDVVPVRYPLDVNAALRERPTAFPLLHPTSLIGRDLAQRIGGFASGMRFSGDAELLRRAAHVARVTNVDHFGYFRRKRRGSLTLGSDTELGSPARQAVQDVLAERALRNAEAARAGRPPDLRPWQVAPRPDLQHLLGPKPDEQPKTPRGPRRRPERSGGAPLFVLGAPRAGHTVLGWALGQHPSFELQVDSRWLARLAADVEARASEDAVAVPSALRTAMADTLTGLAAPSGGRLLATGTELVPAVHALDRLFPDARFIHVVREADDAAAALASAATADGAFYTEEAAWRAWLVATETLLAAENALGSETMLRIRWSDLVEDPRGAMDRCLRFAGESLVPACLRPLRGLETRRVTDLDVRGVPRKLVGRAREVSNLALSAQREHGPEPSARLALADRFHRDRSVTGSTRGSLVERVHALVALTVPEGATVAVVSRGDPRLVDLPGRTGWHVPQVDGVYAGHHPADSREAIEHLERVRSLGAEFLLVPASSLWWLTYYEGLRREIASHATLTAYHDEVGAVFRFGRVEPRTDDGPVAPRFEPVPDHRAAREVRTA